MTNQKSIQERLAVVMQENPDLTYRGFFHRNPRLQTMEQFLEELEHGREQLKNSYKTIEKIVNWLPEHILSTKTAKARNYIKIRDTLEELFKEDVSEGHMIAAAIICGYPYKFADGTFGMSQKSLSFLNKICNHNFRGKICQIIEQLEESIKQTGEIYKKYPHVIQPTKKTVKNILEILGFSPTQAKSIKMFHELLLAEKKEGVEGIKAIINALSNLTSYEKIFALKL